MEQGKTGAPTPIAPILKTALEAARALRLANASRSHEVAAELRNLATIVLHGAYEHSAEDSAQVIERLVTLADALEDREGCRGTALLLDMLHACLSG